MNLNPTSLGLAELRQDAQLAFERLLARGQGRPDREISRDPDYLRLYRAGIQIALAGGEAAIRDAIRELCSKAPADGAEAELERFWFAMGRWQ